VAALAGGFSVAVLALPLLEYFLDTDPRQVNVSL
jgi:hypothetical protein